MSEASLIEINKHAETYTLQIIGEYLCNFPLLKTIIMAKNSQELFAQNKCIAKFVVAVNGRYICAKCSYS